jgi:hypothetical protein
MKCSITRLAKPMQAAAAALLMFAVAPAQAEVAAETPPLDGPRAEFSERTFNFGKVGSGEPLRHDFIVTNVGNALLEITAVQPGCGCTTAGEWDRKIEPGKTGKIPVQFNPGGFSGSVTKYVNITCNDKVHPSQQLQIQATVWRPIEVQPAFVHFMPTEGEETNETKTVRIVNNLDVPITLEKPECTNAAFKTELKDTKPGKEFELHITYVGPVSNAPPNAPITIKTSVTNMPVVNVTAYLMPQAPVVALPAQLQLPATFANGTRKSYVTIRMSGSTSAKVEEAKVNLEGVTVQTTETQPGKMFSITLEFPPDFHLPAGKPAELTVKTTHPRRPVINIPITQLPPVQPPVGVPLPTTGTASKKPTG